MNGQKHSLQNNTHRKLFHGAACNNRNGASLTILVFFTIAGVAFALASTKLQAKQIVKVDGNGKLTITQDSKVIWSSPDEWWVDDFVIADSTNDGIQNLNMTVWKKGSFGPSKPFWISEEKEDKSVKNHFFVYTFANGEIKPVWQSSNLSNPICEFEIGNRDGDGKNELVTTEGEYDLSVPHKCIGKYKAVWEWKEWGFYNVSRDKL